MDQNAALLNARRFAANAYDGEVETIRRQYQLKLDDECARLAARGNMGTDGTFPNLSTNGNWRTSRLSPVFTSGLYVL